MTLTYCERFGFNAVQRQARLDSLELNDSDQKRAEWLQRELICPNARRLAESFYERLLDLAEAHAILCHESFDTERLKHTLLSYLLTLGVDFASEDYFEERLRVGMAHAWVGVPVTLYMAAYRLLQQQLIDAIPGHLSAEDRAVMIALILKIMALDMTLATEAYHRVQVSNLERSLQSMRGREDSLRRQADTDSVTQLPNRRSIMFWLERTLAESVRTNRPLCVIMADLDYFKAINDRYGHLAGDGTLRDVARRITSALRGFDRVGRYGGEEFLIVLADTTLPTARMIAERVRERVGGSPINLPDAQFELTISQGLTHAAPDDNIERLIARADEALYRAKRGGRNCVREL